MSSEYYPYYDSGSRTFTGSSDYLQYGRMYGSSTSYSSGYPYPDYVPGRRPRSSTKGGPRPPSPIPNDCRKLFPGVPCPPKSKKCCKYAEDTINQHPSQCTCRKIPKIVSKTVFRAAQPCKGPCEADPTCQHCMHYEFAPARCSNPKPQKVINPVSFEKYYYLGVPSLSKNTEPVLQARFNRLVPCNQGLKIREITSVDDVDLTSKYSLSSVISAPYESTEYDGTYPYSSAATGSFDINTSSSSTITESSLDAERGHRLMAIGPTRNKEVENVPIQKNHATGPDMMTSKVAGTTYSKPGIANRGISADSLKTIQEAPLKLTVAKPVDGMLPTAYDETPVKEKLMKADTVSKAHSGKPFMDQEFKKNLISQLDCDRRDIEIASMGCGRAPPARFYDPGGCRSCATLRDHWIPDNWKYRRVHPMGHHHHHHHHQHEDREREKGYQSRMGIPCYGPPVLFDNGQCRNQCTQKDHDYHRSHGTCYTKEYEVYQSEGVCCIGSTFKLAGTDKRLQNENLQTVPMFGDVGSQADHTSLFRRLDEEYLRGSFGKKLPFRIPSSILEGLKEHTKEPLKICIKDRGIQTPGKCPIHGDKLIKETVIPVIPNKNIYQPMAMENHSKMNKSTDVYQATFADDKNKNKNAEPGDLEPRSSRTSLDDDDDDDDEDNIEEPLETQKTVSGAEGIRRRRYSDESIASWRSNRSNRSNRNYKQRRAVRYEDDRYKKRGWLDRLKRKQVNEDSDDSDDYDDRRYSRGRSRSRKKYDNRSRSRDRSRRDRNRWYMDDKDYYEYVNRKNGCGKRGGKRRSRSRSGQCGKRSRSRGRTRGGRYRDYDDANTYRPSRKPDSVPHHDEEVECHNDFGIARQIFGGECMHDGLLCGCEVGNWDYIRRPEVLSVFVFTVLMIINLILATVTG